MGRHWAANRSGSVKSASSGPRAFSVFELQYSGEDPEYVIEWTATPEDLQGFNATIKLYQVDDPDVLLETMGPDDYEPDTYYPFEGSYAGGFGYYATLEIAGQAPIQTDTIYPEGGG